ncbi:hypothetical protein GQ600_10442 [Phytophthora cactorum]|nr:hypothetical protein GQ600_10442 [Phytophthora cactorum]
MAATRAPLSGAECPGWLRQRIERWKLNSSGNDNVGLGSTPTPAPTSAPTSSAPPPTVTPCTKSKSKQNGAKQSSNSYKQSGRN